MLISDSTSNVLHFYYTDSQKERDLRAEAAERIRFHWNHHRMLMKVDWESNIFVKLFMFNKRKKKIPINFDPGIC